MKRALQVVVLVTLAMGLICGSAFSAVTLYDTFEGINLGKASSITYGTGVSGQGAVFSQRTDYVQYDASYFSNTGSISMMIKGTFHGTTNVPCTILETAGSAEMGKQLGDLRLAINSNGTVMYRMWTSGTTNVTINSTATIADWSELKIEYGVGGMKLFINGVSQGSNVFAGGLRSTDVFLGDLQADNAYNALWAFPGSVDNFTVTAVPEPSSIAALVFGLVAPVTAIARRRK